MKQHLKLPAILALLAITLSGCIWYGPHGHRDDGGGYYAHPASAGYGGGFHHGY